MFKASVIKHEEYGRARAAGKTFFRLIGSTIRLTNSIHQLINGITRLVNGPIDGLVAQLAPRRPLVALPIGSGPGHRK